MPLFSYACHSDDGKTVRGTITALDREAAELALRDMALTVDELQPALDAVQGAPPASTSLPPVTGGVTVQPSPLLAAKKTPRTYAPLLDTVRLYAGWLLAWYVVIFALGSYASLRALPFEIPFIDELYTSTVILGFALAAYLFLLLSTVHRALGKGVWRGIGLALIGALAFVGFQASL